MIMHGCIGLLRLTYWPNRF